MKNVVMHILNAAMLMVIGYSAIAVPTKEGEPMKGRDPTDREVRLLAEASYLSTVSATNYLSLGRFMTEPAKNSMADFCRKMLLEGKQYFMADFCKVKYAVVGGFDKSGSVIGYYNPFYDAWLLLKLEDAEKVTVNGFKVVSGNSFSETAEGGYPPSFGAIPAENYLEGVFSQTRTAMLSMRDAFAGKDFRKLFDGLHDADAALVERLQELTKVRIGQALKIAEDKRVLRDAVICNAIICRGDTRRFVSDDTSTALTVKTLSESLKEIRSGFKAVAYFPSVDESNLIYNNRLLPTLLIQANVRENGSVRMKMFDAHTITKDIK